MRPRVAARLVIVAVAIVFVGANGWNALHKGGDAQVFFEGGRRLLDAAPLYQNSGPAAGFIGPPFQALFFAPFAAVQRGNDMAARLLWYTINLACMGAGVLLWSSAWRIALARSGIASLHRQSSFWLAVLAILLPLQTNFEHQNMNPVLLAATGGAAWSLVNGKWGLAGGLIGFAAALKAFPAALVIYLGARRFWRSFVVAVLSAALLSFLPLFVYGPERFRDATSAWVQIGSGGWPLRGANQSLIAAIDRWMGGASPAGVRSAADAPATIAVFGAVAVALIVATAALVVARRWAPVQLPCELAGVVTIAVLLSPIAWDHYWVLLFPAFLLACDGSSSRLLGGAGSFAFWTAAILTSGISRATVGRDGWAAARELSVNTIAAVVLYCALLALWRRLWLLSRAGTDPSVQEPAAAGPR